MNTFNIRQPVGNGGLSLRRRSAMLGCILASRKKLISVKRCFFWEDMFFSNNPHYKMNIPSEEIASQFAVESIYNENTVGYHKPWGHLSEKMDIICDHINSKRIDF